MKQVIFFLAILFCICSCKPVTNSDSGKEDQIKMKLIKQAGFKKMNKTFIYEYSEKDDSVVRFLSIVPPGGTIKFSSDEIIKGKLLNSFITPNDHQYNTILMKRGNSYIARVVSIDGNVFEEHVFIDGGITGGGPVGGTPPLLCDDNCSEQCVKPCMDYYQRSVFPALQDSANRICKTLFYRFMCPLNAKNCHWDMLHVFIPEDKYCGSHQDPGGIATRKLAGGIVIKLPVDKKSH